MVHLNRQTGGMKDVCMAAIVVFHSRFPSKGLVMEIVFPGHPLVFPAGGTQPWGYLLQIYFRSCPKSRENCMLVGRAWGFLEVS